MSLIWNNSKINQCPVNMLVFLLLGIGNIFGLYFATHYGVNQASHFKAKHIIMDFQDIFQPLFRPKDIHLL